MPGNFVVIEGVNGAGKTSTLQAVLGILGKANLSYSKGFSNGSSWDHLIHQHPHSILYYLDLACKTQKKIKPQLARGKVVLQDRYVQTVDSYLPDSEWLHNQVARKLLDHLFLRPDLYIHFTASVGEVVSRLSKSASDAYRLDGVRHPEKNEMREEKYRKIYDELTCPKQVIDTTGRETNDCAQELVKILREELPCW